MKRAVIVSLVVWMMGMSACVWNIDVHLPGCLPDGGEAGANDGALGDAEDASADASTFRIPFIPSFSLDAGMDAPPFSYPDGGRRYGSPWRPEDEDGGADAARDVRMDTSSDALRADVVDAGMRDATVPDAGPLDAIVLSPLTCSDRGVRLPSEFFRAGREVWHFCFQTPTLREVTGVGFRPASVVFARRDVRGGFTQDLVYFPAPRTADPWTASVAVSLPLADAANLVLNVRLENGAQVAWAADVPRDGTTVLSRGMLRAWTVARDGAQTGVETRLIRSHCLGTNPDTWFPAGGYLPRGRPCPTETLFCQEDANACSLL